MKVITLEQNTSEWLSWRQGGLGGSDAPIAMGVSPFSKPKKLWGEKCGGPREEITEFQAAIFKRGHDLEPYARQAVNEMLGECFVPICGEHDQHPWMLASFDGMAEDGNTILEIKCPGEKGYLAVLETGAVPEHYMPQVQHQLEVSGAERCIFAVYRPEMSAEPVLVEVFPDPGYIQRLLPIEKGLWDSVVNRDYRLYEEALNAQMPDGFAALAAKHRSLDGQLSGLLAESDAVKEALLEYLPDLGTLKGCGIEVTKTQAKGSIDWKAFCESLGINPQEADDYRKESTIRGTVRIVPVEESTEKLSDWAF